MGWGAELRAGIVGIVGSAILVLLGGLLGLTSGLLFVAGVTAALAGLVAAGSERQRSWIARYAVGLAVLVVVMGALGSWVVALAEGGSLGLLDFLWATTGLLVPFELLVAIVAAAWGARNGPIRG